MFTTRLHLLALLVSVILPGRGLLAVISKSTSDVSEELLQVHILYRHGDRTPTKTFPTNPVKESDWPLPYGQLTTLGIQQHYALGKFLRDRYILGKPYQLLNSTYRLNEIHVRSSDYDRTLMSAYSNLAGMYPPVGNQKWNPSIAWQPIPVHTRPKKTDYMLYMDAECKKYDEILQGILSTPEVVEHEIKNHEFYEFVANRSGIKSESLLDIWKVFDPIYSQKSHNMTIPAWVYQKWDNNRTTFERLQSLQIAEFKLKFTHTGETRLRGGPLLKEVIQNMTMKVTGHISHSDRKCSVYSAHDTTAAAFCASMYAYNDIVPPLAAAVMVELLRVNGSHIVRVMYKNESNHEPYELHISGCSPNCRFEAFVSLTASNIPGDWTTECEAVQIISTQSIILLAAGSFGIILVAIAIVIVIKSRRQRKYRDVTQYRRLDAEES